MSDDPPFLSRRRQAWVLSCRDDVGRQVFHAGERLPGLSRPSGEGFESGAKRNFQVLSPLDFLAEFTQHIPAKGSHLIRYYGWYSNKSRGMRKKVEAAVAEPPVASSSGDATAVLAPSRCSQTWAMLIKRVYEIDPLACPRCGGRMKVIAFIEPPQGEVIEKILRHCGLWQASAARAPPDLDGLLHDLDSGCSNSPTGSSDQAGELTFVDIDTFLATF